MKSEAFEICLLFGFYLQIPNAIVFPFIEKNEKRFLVKATYQKTEISFHAALQKKNETYRIMLSKKLQKELGSYPNDYFTIQFFKDTSTYGVHMPEEFEAVLQSDPEASELFESLTDGKKRGLIYHILKIKNSQTRIDKALLITENLKSGIRDQ